MSGICLCFITVIEETKAYLHPQAVSHGRRTCCVPRLVPPPQNHQVQYLVCFLNKNKIKTVSLYNL